ncbi:Vps52 [Blattamonas nauphoetae]|uniref:Vps52 n=1 Tax=Blattamonas nauphoetae TaxID=2049346 RepID=A0ABQ9Y075_9EUKA|nr:Vps52 [Blattamonas nauphoetae]
MACNKQLEAMENIFISFQNHLLSLTSELRYIQDESLALHVKLKNRKDLSHYFASYLKRITISDDVKRVIEQGPLRVDASQFNNTSPLILSEIARLSMEATQPLLASLVAELDSEESSGFASLLPTEPHSVSNQTDTSSLTTNHIEHIYPAGSSDSFPDTPTKPTTSSSVHYNPSLHSLPFSGEDFPFLDPMESSIITDFDSRPSTLPPPFASRTDPFLHQDPIISSETTQIPPELVLVLSSCITYCAHLHKLQHAIDNASSDNLRLFPSARDALLILTKHANIAMTHCKEYLVNAIRIIRSSERQTHTRVMKEILLRSKGMFVFLEHNNPDVADDIKSQYIEASSKNMHRQCKGYIEMLTKGVEEVCSSKDLLGEKERGVPKRHSSTSFVRFRDTRAIPSKQAFALVDYSTDQASASAPARPTMTPVSISPFELSGRDYVLSPSFTPIPAAFAKQSKTTRWTLEEAFVSCHSPLCSLAVQETVFGLYFFSTAQTIRPTMEALITLYRSAFVPLINTSHDLLALLIIARHLSSMRLTLHQQGTIVLDEYVSELEMQIWPRFRQIVEQHSKSMMKLTMELTDRTSVKKVISRISNKGKEKLDPEAVHFSTQRCAHLVKGIWTLCRTLPSNHFAIAETKVLIDSLLSFYSLVSKECEPAQRTTFLAVNTDFVLNAWMEEGMSAEDLALEVDMKREWRDRFSGVRRAALAAQYE